MKMLGFCVLAILALSACTTEQRASYQYVSDTVKAGEATSARALYRAPCHMTLSGMGAELTAEEQTNIMKVCGIGASGLTGEQIQALMNLAKTVNTVK